MAPTKPSDIPLGTVLRETYEIAGVLGRGGMGTVFLANHLRLPGRQVAIKVLRHDAGMGPEVFVRFRREAEIASKLGHPNIVEVLDFDSLEDGSPYMVMECLRGMPLSRRLRKGPMTLEEVFSCARQMGSALQAAHRAGIVHRDLKPGNVFLVPTEVGGMVMEHVKLLDFGISKVIDSQSVHTQGGILLGTPQYMAPEQATGKNGEVDPRTDIFAFGCLVYEMLARRLPFRDSGSLPELIYRIVYDPPEPLEALVSGLPDHVIAAVEKSLEKRPEDRFAEVGGFITALTGRALQTMGEVPMLTPLSTPRLSVAPASKPETVPGRRPGADGDEGARPEAGKPAFRETETVSLAAPVSVVGSSHDAATIAEPMPVPLMEAPPPKPAVARAEVVPAPIARSPVARPPAVAPPGPGVRNPKAAPVARAPTPRDGAVPGVKAPAAAVPDGGVSASRGPNPPQGPAPAEKPVPAPSPDVRRTRTPHPPPPAGSAQAGVAPPKGVPAPIARSPVVAGQAGGGRPPDAVRAGAPAPIARSPVVAGQAGGGRPPDAVRAGAPAPDSGAVGSTVLLRSKTGVAQSGSPGVLAAAPKRKLTPLTVVIMVALVVAVAFAVWPRPAPRVDAPGQRAVPVAE
ncbi:serine/threonine-protein kinase [Corallococcus macrosporus]|uniref:Serine/threonine protein kinase n=1 Tax=Corallococcus macrosporus DSM 14697 TaxID=1189310 RepID=A0A250JPK2_9BACT|nr:serine/threonine-protein kinase [Corallococcus macrosporus]ATB45311.1 serine/threonine protein kinase [Corallococcus macrosporus DSM 14697]